MLRDARFRITTDYGGTTSQSSFHNAWDMRNSAAGVRLSDPVNATDFGTITRIEPGGTKTASFMALSINKDQTAIYAHTTPCCGIGVGSKVVPGQILGWTDLTGHTSNFHLHFRLLFKGRSVDPNVYFGPSVNWP